MTMRDVLFGAPDSRLGPDARRAVLFAVCLAASVAVQAGAWQAAAAVIGRETAGGRAAGEGRSSRPIDTSAATAAAVAAPTRAADSTPGAEAVAARKTTVTRPPRTRAQPTATGPTPVESDSDNALDRPRFYSFREVDIPAEPVSQWNLDPTALDALATSRIVFTLLVGSDGTVLHCSVDEPERLPAAARRSLEAKLKATEMRPARRGGVAVASRRRVELYTEGGL